MEYCRRCCYPANTRPYIIFDDKGICSGCRLLESRPNIDWEERGRWLKELLDEYKTKAREAGDPYDCIIPVSGGKDSHYQTYLMKQVYDMNPLLVCYNHIFNTKRGIRNLTNLLKKLPCDLIRFTTSPETAKKLSKHMLKTVGDITWHYHAGIMTFPIQIAVKYKIPLIVWGEHGFSELIGMFNQDDMVEFTKKVRLEHSIRGFEPEDIVNDPNSGLTMRELSPFQYPSDEETEEIGVRGIYLSNYIPWDAREHARLMIDKFGFETAVKRERTFHVYEKLEDIHADGAHDYLKYLKFGYGRATDDASMDIRHGRMTREEGIEMVKKYDHIRPSDLDIYLRFTGMTEEEFEESIEHMRDPEIWEKVNGKWQVKDSIANHINDEGVEEARLPLGEDREIFPPSPQPYYSRDDHIPEDTEYIIL